MKKILIALLALIAIIMAPINAFAEDKTNVINLGVSDADPQYDPQNDYVNLVKENQMKYQLGNANSDKSGITTMKRTCYTRKQITSYWCGLASAEQVIRAYGNTNNLTATYGSLTDPVLGYVSGSYHQFTINNYLGGVGTGGASASQITDAINHFSTGSFTWGYRHIPGNGTSAGQELLQYAVSTIGNNAKCCVVFADTTYYPYYGGTVCYHWVTLNGYSQSMNVASSYFIVDPHYSTSYMGPHEVTAYQMGMAIERYNSKPNLIW